MKNACIVFKSDKSSCMESIFSIIEPFNGYDFSEIRILSILNDISVKRALTEFSGLDNVVFIFKKEYVSQIKALLLSNVSQGIFQMEMRAGVIYQAPNTTYYLLFEDSIEEAKEYAYKVCIPRFQQKNGMRYDKYIIRTVGASKEYVKRLLEESVQMAGGNLFYQHKRRFGEDIIELYYNGNISKMLLDDIIRKFADGLEECIYALEDVSLEEQLVRLLKIRGRKISVAESFTGGGIGNRIVSVSGASEVYFEGLNTYNEDAKIKRLNVSKFTLKTQGAVSEQTAYEMASGLIATEDCDIAIATTGLAGPKSDKSLLPVGLCYIAIGLKERVFVYRYQFDGSREEITQTAINYALFLAYKQLKN